MSDFLCYSQSASCTKITSRHCRSFLRVLLSLEKLSKDKNTQFFLNLHILRNFFIQLKILLTALRKDLEDDLGLFLQFGPFLEPFPFVSVMTSNSKYWLTARRK